MSPLISAFSGRVRQHGAIGLMAALTLGLAVLCMLLVIDSGTLYLEKRNLQRVADMAALEAATRLGQCTPANTAATYAIAAATRNGFTVTDSTRTLTTDCGTVALAANNLRAFSVNATQNQAIRVVVTHWVNQSIAGGISALFPGGSSGTTINLSATAVAAVPPPVAMLTIRSTLLVADSSNSIILNGLFGGLLGSTVNLSAVGWNGLINSNISLLGYLNQLKLDLGITAVGYSQLLSTTVSVSQLLQSAITVLDPTGTLGATASIGSLQALKAAAGSTTVMLGDLLQVKGGTETAALTSNLQLFQLVEGLVQLANKSNGLVAVQTINLGVLSITSNLKVLQPAQISAVGNPALAALNPLGPDKIYVRTAQVRALLSVNLPLLTGVAPLVSAVANLTAPITNTLNSLLSLNLAGAVGALACAIGVPCTYTNLLLLPTPEIDVSLDVGSGESYVTNYSCASSTNKTLTTHTNLVAAALNIGSIPTSVIPPGSTAPPAVVALPIPVLDIGTRKCSILVVIPVCTVPRIPWVGGGIGISANSTVAQSIDNSTPPTFSSPNLPEITQPPYYRVYSTANIVSSLSSTIAGVQVNMYAPTAGNNGVLGPLVTGLGTLLTSITSALQTVVASVLSPLLDTLLNTLLASLGINLNEVDVGANLTCGAGQASLVI
ncbi:MULTISPECIES: pilus assembly protein TadG-related protein [unclassified Pseudomonas]|uniref:pilus assembly protein TadG-related protein n=1 Tax=unclassified Pseudomonas TaxID=196821 RepID=UPI002AC97463|nr:MULTISPECIES: pilus assembly protein TadG-related protein [unclassified Pseudomonas]MEB0041624.1 pilus assembly protein TadG-related protein [Pseudomonas sp. MH10]MEB0122000.1 pilus assembly protein TadG-related protein [Pseudomonas sp. CCI1.2]WPX61937.1 pilus assembly protein TadG-related protein [Pseudomonas sp. MH10]